MVLTAPEKWVSESTLGGEGLWGIKVVLLCISCVFSYQ